MAYQHRANRQQRAGIDILVRQTAVFYSMTQRILRQQEYQLREIVGHYTSAEGSALLQNAEFQTLVARHNALKRDAESMVHESHRLAKQMDDTRDLHQFYRAVRQVAEQSPVVRDEPSEPNGGAFE